MNGCRGLSDQEIELVSESFHRLRDKCLFILGVKTGFRITELLSIRVKDVVQFSRLLPRLRIYGCKAGDSREVVLHPMVKPIILELISSEGLLPDDFLFQSRNGYNQPLSRYQAWNVLTSVFDRLELQGKLATHSMRKSFCMRVYKALSYDLVMTQKAMGHKAITSTIAYIPIDQETIDSAVLGS